MEPILASLLSLDDRCAVVTGAGRGIGASVAHLLAAAGARVIVADIDLNAAAHVASEISMLGQHADAIGADVTSSRSARELMARAVRVGGRLDVLVNNVGSHEPTFAAAPGDLADWRRVVGLNLDSVYVASMAAAAHLGGGTDGGAIVNLASAAVLGPGVGASYDAAKAGVVQLTRSLALDLAPRRVRVNAVAPGHIRTGEPTSDVPRPCGPAAEGPATDRDLEGAGRGDIGAPPESELGPDLRSELRSYRAQRIPLGHAGLPADVAKAVLFLVSELSSYVTGQTLLVDGGWSLL